MARVLQAPVSGAALSGGCLGPLIYCLAQQEVGSGCLGTEQGMLTSCLEFEELACLGWLKKIIYWAVLGLSCNMRSSSLTRD